mmetsp:Transcript_17504/g.52889  ORF Transcript_17504/g.52889 Transcript_17504/m.52889 type:complete len:307 (-) Transcript_17504:1697-2617(-)
MVPASAARSPRTMPVLSAPPRRSSRRKVARTVTEQARATLVARKPIGTGARPLQGTAPPRSLQGNGRPSTTTWMRMMSTLPCSRGASGLGRVATRMVRMPVRRSGCDRSLRLTALVSSIASTPSLLPGSRPRNPLVGLRAARPLRTEHHLRLQALNGRMGGRQAYRRRSAMCWDRRRSPTQTLRVPMRRRTMGWAACSSLARRVMMVSWMGRKGKRRMGRRERRIARSLRMLVLAAILKVPTRMRQISTRPMERKSPWNRLWQLPKRHPSLWAALQPQGSMSLRLYVVWPVQMRPAAGKCADCLIV